jgi:S-adenosylmethionine hydrolase
MMKPLITLTTDFGQSDGYVAAMKGVILSINPEAIIVDITHNITPQNIVQAAFVLNTAAFFFPEGTIHVAVADPGVGTARKPIILSTGREYFVAPDNGILSYVINELQGKPELKSYVIENPEYWRNPVSRTFHGRDIFAPAAAYLSRGVPLENFGKPLLSLNTFTIPQPRRNPDGSIAGEIIYSDAFGNLISNIKENDMPGGEIMIEIAGKMIKGLSLSYEEKTGLLAIIGSSGRLEIALRKGSAADYLGVGEGTEVKIDTYNTTNTTKKYQ